MSGGDYAPKDSRDVTLRDNAPGSPKADWHDQQTPEPSRLAPEDSRTVTGAAAAPGEPTDWQAKPDGTAPDADADARPPSGVPQADPVSADEAAAAERAAPD